MSKPISISLGKAKATSRSTNNSAPQVSTTTNIISKKPTTAFSAAEPDDQSDDDERAIPAHESVIGFAADGAPILKEPLRTKQERVIENKGNAEWRTRGRVPLRQKEGGADNAGEAMAEKEEASKRVGLQYAEEKGVILSPSGDVEAKTEQQQEPQTQDQAALSALLNGHDTSKPPSSSITTINQQSHPQVHDATGDETLDFRADVASRPDPSSLDDYAAMPVEEFGMALLRGMGKKRRANGEVIVIRNPNESDEEDDVKKKREKGRNNNNGLSLRVGSSSTRDPNMGFLGIGAKAVKIGDAKAGQGQDALLGAWGKSDMRKGKQGGGGGTGVMYTPVMLRDRRTGELISERELEERKKQKQKKAAETQNKAESRHKDDWRDRNRTRHDSDEKRDRDRDRPRHHQQDKSKPLLSSSSSSSVKPETRAIEDSYRHSSRHHRSRSRSRSNSRPHPHSNSSEKARQRSRSRRRHRHHNHHDDKEFDHDRHRDGDYTICRGTDP